VVGGIDNLVGIAGDDSTLLICLHHGSTTGMSTLVNTSAFLGD
jgi:hypothetical protein